MTDPSSFIKKATVGALILIGIALIVWYLVPEWKEIAAGLTLGLIFSLVNGWYFSLKAQQLAQMAVDQSKKRGGLGFLVRAGLSLLAVAIAVDKEGFNVLATIIGLFYFYFALVFLSVIALKNDNQR
jgi:ATP synthase protein I